MFYVSDVDNLYDEVLSERKGLDEQRILESCDLQSSSWLTEGKAVITITNEGSLSIDITRIWVVPTSSVYQPQSFPQQITLKPGSTCTIIDESIINYISTLFETSYYLKIVSKRGNVFQADFVMEEELIDWPYPLVILDTSICQKSGSNYELALHVYNKEDISFIVDYTVITLLYFDSGHKTRVIIIEDDLEFPPRQMWLTEILTFSTTADPDLILVEFVSPDRFALGSFYFTLFDETPSTGIDLTLSEADISFKHPKTLMAEIHNIGDLKANNVLVEFYNGNPTSGGILIGTDTISTINAGGSQTAIVDWNPPLGLYLIYVIVDPENTIAEANEANNQAYASIAIS
jgi:hypothetical protein